MKLRTIKFDIDDSGKESEIQVPLQCPHCGLNSHVKHVSNVITDTYDEIKFILEVYKYPCCGSHVFALYKNFNDKFELINFYPRHLANLEESIKNISPRFVQMYSDCLFAYNENMFDLAGCGFRNALEILIKDYAIKELKEDPNSVAKTTLFNAIDKYLPDDKLKKSADVVRILGNDFTHYQRKYEKYDVELLMYYLDIFILEINTNYRVNHPPVSR
ncbi:DUF4145 domain-containing protein [Helcococcus bovis]|uniref:DUF4145 domain-containing protein n=1 Tax=Helcococcus bovis TaxID=3153252 RepID=UPI0038B7D02B